MTEKEKFNLLLSRNPFPGKKNKILREGNIYKLPGWIIGKPEIEELNIRYKTVKRFLSKYDLTDQIVWDVYVLGLTKFEDRPKCPICGKDLKFRSFGRGNYSATCCSKECKREYARIEVFNLWKDKTYREQQSKSHVEWSAKEENKALMSERCKRVWATEGYREHQSMVHKEFAKNNPDKIRNGIHGTIECSKASSGSLRYDSTWERDFISMVDDIDEIISLERVPFYIPYIYEGKEFNYFPDFHIVTQSGKNFIIEIKARWMIKYDQKTPIKLKAAGEFIKESSNIFDKFILLDETNLCKKYGKGDYKFNVDIAREELIRMMIN